MRATHLLIAIPLDEKVGDAPSPLDLDKALEQELGAIFSVIRQRGFFHMKTMQIHGAIGTPPKPKTGLIPAEHPKRGVGIFVTFLPSQLDLDFGLRLWAPEAWQIEAIKKAIDWSQRATFELLGRGFGGEMPYAPSVRSKS